MGYKDMLNYGAGLVLGCIAFPMYIYSKFLYYTVFAVQVVIIYILINIPYKGLKCKTQNQ